MKAADMGVRVETGMRWLIVGHGSVGSALARRASTAGVLTELGFHVDAAGGNAAMPRSSNLREPRGIRLVPAARLKGLLADAAARVVKEE
jgi:predicted dinucleotide-binding enzyme